MRYKSWKSLFWKSLYYNHKAFKTSSVKQHRLDALGNSEIKKSWFYLFNRHVLRSSECLRKKKIHVTCSYWEEKKSYSNKIQIFALVYTIRELQMGNYKRLSHFTQNKSDFAFPQVLTSRTYTYFPRKEFPSISFSQILLSQQYLNYWNYSLWKGDSILLLLF